MDGRNMSPRSVIIVAHEGQALLLQQKRIKTCIGPGGRLEAIHHQDSDDESGSSRNRSCFWYRQRTILLVSILIFGFALFSHRLSKALQWIPRKDERGNNESTDNGQAFAYRSYNRQDNDKRNHQQEQRNYDSTEEDSTNTWRIALCPDGRPCFEQEMIRVSEDRPNVPSFWDYGSRGPINVSYSKRAILLNSTPTLLLGGSMHPVRATPQSWNLALDEAVRQGLNLISIYIFWNAHQPFSKNDPYNWSLLPVDSNPPDSISSREEEDESFGDTATSTATTTRSSQDSWDLAHAIRAAANRGLFVHARIGPYTCGEYNYGGIPEWVPLHQPNMSMRRPNQEWMDAMEEYVKEVTLYLRQNNLWAYQGGPIILGQIENELGTDGLEREDPAQEHYILKQGNENHQQNQHYASLQDYADWSGAIAQKYEPQVLWTMCNGLTAPNTINTCNGYGGSSCSTSFLESHGQTGRIQVDQPAMWTEAEQGFQVWGEEASHPTSYFWGQTARSVARQALQWFARGGSHLNYYMWWGGYNRGRSAASGITNMYASDAPLCPSGQRREPKFSHLQALHETLIDIAPILMESPSALGKNQSLEVMSSSGQWVEGTKQQMHVYSRRHVHRQGRIGQAQECIFIENNADHSVILRYRRPGQQQQQPSLYKTIKMMKESVVVIIDGILAFDSGTISPRMKNFRRVNVDKPVDLLDWHSWKEPILGPSSQQDDLHSLRVTSKPVEQTDLIISSRVSSDYAWYQTSFTVTEDMNDAEMLIETVEANALSLFLNNQYIDATDRHFQKEGNVTLSISIGDLKSGDHVVSILSESLGYFNLIGRWGASTKAKIKGIVGAVTVIGNCLHTDGACSYSLADGNHEWKSLAGLQGKENGSQSPSSLSSSPCTWSRALFDTPIVDISQALFLDITSGRGKIWLNGLNLGRFWNITSGEDGSSYTQRYYYLPTEYLYDDGNLNELILFNSLGSDGGADTQLVLSGIEADEDSAMEDEVNFPSACI